MRSVLTLTMNPAVDLSMSTRRVEAWRKLRCSELRALVETAADCDTASVRRARHQWRTLLPASTIAPSGSLDRPYTAAAATVPGRIFSMSSS